MHTIYNLRRKGAAYGPIVMGGFAALVGTTLLQRWLLTGSIF